MSIEKLIENVSTNYTGKPIQLDRGRQTCRGGFGVMPIQVYGITTGAKVIFQATMSDSDIDNAIKFGNEIWSPIENGSFIQNTATSLSVPFAYVRVVVEIEEGSVGNSITVTMDK